MLIRFTLRYFAYYVPARLVCISGETVQKDQIYILLECRFRRYCNLGVIRLPQKLGEFRRVLFQRVWRDPNDAIVRFVYMSGTKHRKSSQHDASRIHRRFRDCQTEAIVCTRDSDGRAHFQTPKHIDLVRDVPMDWAPDSSGSAALASAILYEFFGKCPHPYVGTSIDMTVESLSRRFLTDFLHTMPREGGVIPLAIIEEWLLRQLGPAYASGGENSPDEPPAGSESCANLPDTPFSTYGLVCSRDTQGRPIYNIEQVFWLRPDTQMDWWDTAPEAIESLAINAVERFLDHYDPSNVVRCKLDNDLWSLYTPFVEDFLFAMPKVGGIISLQAMTRWVNQYI